MSERAVSVKLSGGMAAYFFPQGIGYLDGQCGDFRVLYPALAGDDDRPFLHDAPGPRFADIKVAGDDAGMVLPDRDGTLIKNRFRRALLGAA